ncbi:mediator of RNA polymerase II transcription subunit 12-like [Phoenix dactylifera]|uniref:Mediator of RNA polymerase II transcription subunit 12-like n=1 Tax=Phoenix dactylifera TaxID=42345 RepID=A0A8B7D167_PHODC|nr:mediator of RNA polymerase II transcription subunit 12-like [Phoenix dactylifera]XP_038982724.1 mediator of RNA polymerase II transcription subunit 12-like [Phoenix dactylifera]
MQRFSAASCGAGVSNSAIGGASARENARAESSFSPSNFSLNPRRQPQLSPYKLKCDKESLNSRLGPPDFYPQIPNCPEETLTREYLQSGYKETVEGIEEAREITLGQIPNFLKPEFIVKCKEAIRKRLRAINESRAQKRKAGQVYGVPLSGPLLIKPGLFPEQWHCSGDFRRKWIEVLSQHHKRLHSLAEHVPHGYRRKSLFEVLIRHNVPFLRATWFIKVTYLNQVRPASTSVSSGPSDKTQLSCTDLWTKDVTDYLQQLLDEFFSKDGSFAPILSRDQSSQGLIAGPGPAQHKSDSVLATPDAEEPSLPFKWWYMVQLLRWHYAEGLLHPSPVIEWVLNQLQEKDSAEALELLLPVVFDLMESIVLSQTNVRMLADIAVRSINDLSSSDLSSVDDLKKSSPTSALVGILQYMILSVPDTFVALDCFPLPSCVAPDLNCRNTVLKVPEGVDGVHFDTRDAYLQYLSCGYTVSSIQKRACNLAKIVNPSLQGHGAAKVVQALDKALITGDLKFAYNSLFEDLSDIAIEEQWIAEVSPCLRSSLKWIGTVRLPLICCVFFLCEWATCDYRDCRTSLPQNHKSTGRKDFSQVYLALLLLKFKIEDMCSSSQSKSGSTLLFSTSGKAASVRDTSLGGTLVEQVSAMNNMKSSSNRKHKMDIFQSPGPLHDIIVCWIDQHEVGSAGGFKHVEVFIMELIRNGIFYPQAYVRQLIVSGIMDRNVTAVDLERQRRHQKILKQLPGSCLFDVLEEAKVVEAPLLDETVSVYSNERRLMLHGLLNGESNHMSTKGDSYQSFALQKHRDHSAAVRGGKHVKMKDEAAELKILISTLLHFPYPYSMQVGTCPDESQGSFRRPLGSFDIKVDLTEGTPGCEECRRAKRQKLGDERVSPLQGFSSNQSDDEDSWWVRKGPKSQESFKVEPPLKATKHPSRGRQKTVRKTQSLAQLAAARIESSQGASTSHVCDNKVSCPHHKSVSESEVPKDADLMKATHLSDIGKAIKQLRWLEKRSISIWLLKAMKQLVEENEKATSKVSNCTGVFSAPADDGISVRWTIGEDELLSILYILDTASDLVSVVKLLLWLLQKTLGGPSTAVHVGRSITVPKNRENQVCKVGESFLLSSLQRYENVLLATDLLPEVLTTLMHRTVAFVTPNGKSFGSTAFAYARNLLKKYRDVASVTKWEKTFRATCDQRLLAELDAGRPLDGDLVFSSGVPAGVEDTDEYIRQKMTGRLSRTSPNLKEMVQRHVEEAVHYFYGKERKLFSVNNPKGSSLENWEDSNQIAQDIVLGLLDCIRQNGGATLEGDPSIVASAVSAIVGSVGPAISKLPDFTSGNYQSFLSTTNSLNCVRHILQIHITSLCLLKESLGERMSRIFEIALAAEASSSISGAFAPGKTYRSQFQPSSETHDMYGNHSNELVNNSVKLFVGRAAKAAAAVSALVIGAIVHGATSLERMVTAFKLKEGLDILQFIRSARSSSNGMSRSVGSFKLDHCIEVYIHWFRLLVGNCRTVFDGLVAEILGESYIIALSRMQRMLPLNLVFPPAYSIFGMVIWRPYILNINIAAREDVQLYQNLFVAIGDAIRHQPFRELCFRNTRVLYDLLATDVGDSEFAAMLELHSSDKHLKTRAFVPLRSRLFLNALIDCKMPAFTIMQEDGSWISGPNEQRAFAENEAKLQDQLVHVLDNLQPAKFHWQWVVLRLLLNEQALIEKTETQNMSLVEAIRSLSPNTGNVLSESEKKFTEIILTRILVRPDAAPLYSEVVHLLGNLQQESLVMDIKWILAGQDVLLGRKSIRQQLLQVAQRKGLSTKSQFWKPWGWSSSIADGVANRGDKRKLEAISIEEGELVDECIDVKKPGKMNIHNIDAEGFTSTQQYITEKALAELTLPCIDRSSSDIRNLFAAELVKQMGAIDQQINTITRGGNKQASAASSGTEGSSNKSSIRKGMRGGSPVLGRRSTGVSDSTPPSATALKASLWLRLQFLLRLLPIIYTDREPSARNMRQMLASIILRLLGARVVHEDADLYLPMHRVPSQKDAESLVEGSVAASLDYSSDSLFDRLLCILHGLLSNCKPSWLKPKSVSKSTVKSPRDFSAFDRETAESLQADLDRMELPATIRRRIQAAMPILPASLPFLIPCHSPTSSSLELASLQPITSTPGTHQRFLPTTRTSTNLSGRSKTVPSQYLDMEIDPWTLLEDGTGSASASGGNSHMIGVGGDHSNLKACSWLKGAVRVRRTDLTYVGSLDDDS